MILGMDPWVFIAWIGTIISALFCVLYGIYYEYLKIKLGKKTKESKEKEDY
jgi:hypothetical protein